MLRLLHCLLGAEPGTLWNPRGGGAALSLSHSNEEEELLTCLFPTGHLSAVMWSCCWL